MAITLTPEPAGTVEADTRLSSILRGRKAPQEEINQALLDEQFNVEEASRIRELLAKSKAGQGVSPLVMSGNETLFAPPVAPPPGPDFVSPYPKLSPITGEVPVPGWEKAGGVPMSRAEIASTYRDQLESAESLRREQEMERYLGAGMKLPASSFGRGGLRGLGTATPKIVKSGRDIFQQDPITGELTQLYNSPEAPENMDIRVLPGQVMGFGRQTGKGTVLFEGPTKEPTGIGALMQQFGGAGAPAGSPAAATQPTPNAPSSGSQIIDEQRQQIKDLYAAGIISREQAAEALKKTGMK